MNHTLVNTSCLGEEIHSRRQTGQHNAKGKLPYPDVCGDSGSNVSVSVFHAMRYSLSRGIVERRESDHFT